jgi:hypothetical protein
MFLCVCNAHSNVGYVVAQQNRQGPGTYGFTQFFFNFVDLGSRVIGRSGRAKRDGDGMIWDDMWYDYDTRVNYCIISATGRMVSVYDNPPDG